MDFILRQDQLEGVKVFIKRQECEEQKKLPVDVGKCENILNFLQQFPIAKMTYLEFLVKQKKLQVSFKLLINFPHTSKVKCIYGVYKFKPSRTIAVLESVCSWLGKIWILECEIFYGLNYSRLYVLTFIWYKYNTVI